jgi:hypothetical protein
MMTLPVPATTISPRIPVPSPTVAGNDGRFADALATHLAQRGASPQARTDGARDHTAATGDDGPRPAPTEERRVDARSDDGARRTDRNSGTDRSDRAHEPADRTADRIGDRDRADATSSADDNAAADNAERTEAGDAGDVENRTPTDDAGDTAAKTDDAAAAPTDGTDESTETLAATAVPVAIDAEARVAVLALGALIAEAAPATTSGPTGEGAATGDEQTTARTLAAAVGARAEATTTGSNATSLAATAAATATATDGDATVVAVPVVLADGDAAPVATTQSTPVAATTTPTSALAAALDAATTETGDQAASTMTNTTNRGMDQQPATTAAAPATTATPVGSAANPAVAVATVPALATNAAATGAAPTAVSSTTVDGSVATATSTTQALSNPGVARGELTAPQRLAAVIAPEVDRMRGTVGHRTLEIRLDPPDLGTVDLEIRSSGSTVTIVARTESAEAMLAVLRQRDSIEASLRELGMDLSGFDVSAGTPEREQAENRRDNATGGAATGSAADAVDLDAEPSAPLVSEGSVFL